MKKDIETRDVAEMARSENRQAVENLVITPEMIEAGVGLLLRYHRERSDEADVVREIFERMISVRDRCL